MDITAAAQRINAISHRYAEVYGFERTDDWLVMKLQEELGELASAHLARTGRRRGADAAQQVLDDAFAHELADVLGLVLALGASTGVDIPRAIDEKWFVWDRRDAQRVDELDPADLVAGERPHDSDTPQAP